jgi:hypothetical protein
MTLTKLKERTTFVTNRRTVFELLASETEHKGDIVVRVLY